MRTVAVTIINRKGNGAFIVDIKFYTVDVFMRDLDLAIDNCEFYKVDLDFDTEVFTPSEIETLKEKGFLF